MRVFSSIVLSVFFSLTVFATAQIPDKVIYNGKEYMLHNNPLESYFEKYPDKRPKVEVWSNALYRGYIATFEIKGGQLYLKDIEILSSYKRKEWKTVRKEVFPKQKSVKIDWMTGILVLPSGKLLNYVDMGYASTFERYTLLEINGGKLVKEKVFEHDDCEKFKEKQFKVFKETDDYKKLKADIQKRSDWTDEAIDSYLQTFVLEFSTKILVN